MNLKGKTAVVTGSSDGIGKQIALKLASEGVDLALVARDLKRLSLVEDECLKLGSAKVKIYSLDLKDKKQINEGVKKISSDFEEIDILINCAGIWQKVDDLEKISEEVIEEVIFTDLTGQILFTRNLLPKLKSQKESIILNISSKSGVTAQQGQSVYTAAKWGMTGFTEVLKQDLKGTGVRVAGVYQSGTNTDMFRKTGEKFEQEKFTNPSDLADVVIFMLSRPQKIWLHEVRVEY